MRKLAAGLAILTASCSSQPIALNRIDEIAPEMPIYVSRMDDITYFHEVYFHPSQFEPSLEERLKFENHGNYLVKKLGAGTGHEVNAYLLKGREDGPTAMVLAPHGDEVGAWKAAEALLRYEVLVGNLIVVPWLDNVAVRAKARYNFMGGADPNREYGEYQSGTYVSRIANDVKKLIMSKEISLVLNLHEAFGYNSLNPSHLGHTLIVDTDQMAEKARGMLPRINKGLHGRLRFTVLMQPNSYTLTYFCIANGVDAYGVETSKNLDDELSKEIHLANATMMLDSYGIKIRPRSYKKPL